MRYIFVCCIIFSLFACRPETYTPKPRGYFTIDLPQKQYRLLDTLGLPYTFEYPVYGRIEKDTTALGRDLNWFNIDFPELGGKIYVTYKTIDGSNSFDKLLADAHELTYTAHGKRADFIDMPLFDNGHGVIGRFYTVGGNAATRHQFFATDSAKHFLHAALYFNTTPNADSLKPLTDFLYKDMQHMLNTMRWR